MPTVSIIIPTYNAARFIDKTIQSVLDQTYADWELIIVDDCSKDNTRSLLEEWRKKDGRIQVIFLDKNSGGPAHPKNVAFPNTQGKYIAYLDHDDEWLPEKLEKQVKVLQEHPEVGLVSCEAFIMDENEKILNQGTIKKVPLKNIFPEILYTDFAISNSSMVIPRVVINKIGERDEDK